MLLSLMLEFHAWSTARPLHENERTADELEKEINALMATEKEQGMSSTLLRLLVGTPMFPSTHPLSLAALSYLC